MCQLVTCLLEGSWNRPLPNPANLLADVKEAGSTPRNHMVSIIGTFFLTKPIYRSFGKLFLSHAVVGICVYNNGISKIIHNEIPFMKKGTKHMRVK